MECKFTQTSVRKKSSPKDLDSALRKIEKEYNYLLTVIKWLLVVPILVIVRVSESPGIIQMKKLIVVICIV